tara:strand:+ start:174 stop:464 length:291 start_codon:yes stop_codon:yes gene_type:complete
MNLKRINLFLSIVLMLNISCNICSADDIESIYVVTTIAGSGRGYADGKAENSKFYWPRGVAIDKDGSIIVVDSQNARLRKIKMYKRLNNKMSYVID